MIPDYKKVLIKKLSLCIALALSCVLYVVAIFAIDQYRQRHLQRDCDKQAQSDFNQLVDIVESQLTFAKSPLVDIYNSIQRDSNFLLNEDQIYAALEKGVIQNDNLYGATMGFEDWVFPKYADKGGFGPHVRRNGDKLQRQQLGQVMDFRNSEGWHRDQSLSYTAGWSKPFFAEDHSLICSYIMPLFQEERFMGCMGIDVDMNRFANSIECFRPYPSCLIVLVDDELNIITHPNRQYMGRNKLTEAMQRVGIDPRIHPMYHSKDRQAGVAYDYMGPRRMAFYYAPVPETNWMVLLYCPTDEIYAPIMTRHIIYISLAILGFLALGTLFGLSVFKFFRSYYTYHHF